MAEYIDRQAVLDAIPQTNEDKTVSLFGAVADFIVLVNEIPAADVAPVVHGHWVDECKCSACGEMSYEEAKSDETDPNCYYVLSDYCPNCGARMGEVEDDV